MPDRIPSPGHQGIVPAHLGWAVAHFPPGRIRESRRLVGTTAAAVLVDYERDDAVSGTWFSERMHFFDMTLSKRPEGARGSFAEAAAAARPVGKILFAPAGFHYRGEGGSGRQKSISVFLDCPSDDELRTAISGRLVDCVALESAEIRDLLLRIAREVADPGFASQLLLEGLSLSLLVQTARALRGIPERAGRKGGLTPSDLRSIRERLVEGTPPSLRELATLCRVSQRQLVRAFRAETGETIGAYVRTVMMRRAEHMLAETDLPIGEIATRLGFARASAFSTAFHRVCGRTPRDYRRCGRRTVRVVA